MDSLLIKKHITSQFVCSRKQFSIKIEFQNNFEEENNSNKASSNISSYSLLPIFIIQSTFKGKFAKCKAMSKGKFAKCKAMRKVKHREKKKNVRERRR